MSRYQIKRGPFVYLKLMNAFNSTLGFLNLNTVLKSKNPLRWAKRIFGPG